MKKFLLSTFLILLSQQTSASALCANTSKIEEDLKTILNLERETSAVSADIICNRGPESDKREREIEFILNKIAEIDALSPQERRLFLNQNSSFKKYFQQKGTDFESIISLSSDKERSLPGREAFEEAVKQKYVEFAASRACAPELGMVLNRSRTLAEEPRLTEDEPYSETRSRLEQALQSEDVKERHSEYQKEGALFIVDEDTIRNCKREYHVDKTNKNFKVKKLLEPCSQSFSHHFADNEWDIPGGVEKLDAFKSLRKCVTERQTLFDEVKVEKIRISSSSSRLLNTGKAQDLDFKELSRKRALTAKNKIVSHLLRGANLSGVEKQTIQMDFEGLNGDGTSGPCPYNKEGRLKEEFQKGGHRRNELDAHKFVTITVSFQPHASDVGEKEYHVRATYPCAGVQFKCKN